MASKNAGDARNRSKKADDIRIQNMNAAKGNFYQSRKSSLNRLGFNSFFSTRI